jgi:hypothetical protein
MRNVRLQPTPTRVAIEYPLLVTLVFWTKVQCLQKGCAKVGVVSRTGREATVTLLFGGDFVGEGGSLVDLVSYGIRHCH